MNLRAWIGEDLAGVRSRFDQQIAAHLPVEHWRATIEDHSAAGRGSSVAGLLLHLCYHHDLAVTTAVLDRPPLLAEHREALGLTDEPPETGLAEAEARAVVERLDPAALVAYFDAVTRQSVEWIGDVSSYALDTVAPTCRRLEQRAGVRGEAVPWLFAMWDAKPVGWLVRWEAIAHPYTHLGEMTALRNALGFSPF